MSFKKWGIARAVTQVGVLLLIVSPLMGLPIFRGNLAAGEIATVPLADPLAALQVICATGIVIPSFLVAATGVTLFYWLLGGRTFCAWVCPVYLLTEITARFRKPDCDKKPLPLAWKFFSLALVLVLTVATGLPFFEIVSPIGMVTRAVVFATWIPLLAVLGIIILELLGAERIWCRSLCPLGGWYAMLGRFAPVRIFFHQDLCTSCQECRRVCPVPEVLDPPLLTGDCRVRSGDCTRCARCIDICPTKALTPGCGYSAQGGT